MFVREMGCDNKIKEKGMVLMVMITRKKNSGNDAVGERKGKLWEMVQKVMRKGQCEKNGKLEEERGKAEYVSRGERVPEGMWKVEVRGDGS